MNTKFHFVKLQKTEKRWLTYFKPSPQRLQRLLKKHNPKNAYVSVNQYLRYKEHDPAQNILLNKFGLIDIDGQNFNNKEEVKQYFIKINKFLKEHNIGIVERVCTNDTIGGYQILIKPSCLKDFYKLLQNHPKCFEKCDDRVYDPKRVRRMPNTFNGNRNSFSYYVDEFGNPKDLNTSNCNVQSAMFFAKKAKKDGEGRSVFLSPLFIPATHATGMPDKADDNKGKNPDFTPTKQRAGKGCSSNLPAHYVFRQMSNTVQGLKSAYIPAVKLSYKPSSRRLKKLQKSYNLGDLYVFRCHSGYFMLSPKIFQPRRLLKVYKAFKSWGSYNELLRFKVNWIPISNIVDIDTRQKVDSFEFLGVFEQEALGWYSATHLNFLNHYFKKEYPAMIGNPLKVYLAEFTRD